MTEHQGGGASLLMSGELRDWLTGLREQRPAAARDVGHALAAVLNAGGGRGEPLVASTVDAWPAALAYGLDQAYQVRLRRLTALRHGMDDADSLMDDLRRHGAEIESAPELGARVFASSRRLREELQRLSASAIVFRARKDVLKARCSGAQFALLLDEADAAEARGLRDAIAAMELELGQEPWPDGLLELRPADSGACVLFAVEPPGSVLLIAVLDGPEAVRDQYSRALLLSAGVLRQVRAGQAAEATECRYGSAREFLAEFFPGDDEQEG